MKICSNPRRKISSCWKLVLCLSIMIGLSCSHAANPPIYNMTLTVDQEKWVMSEVYLPAFHEDNFSSVKMMGMLVRPEGEAKVTCRLVTNFSIPPNMENAIVFTMSGNNTFKDKIKVAAITHQLFFPDSNVLIFRHEDEGDIAAVTISTLGGKQICLITAVIQIPFLVKMETTLCFWKISLCACSVLLTMVTFVLLCYVPWKIMVRREERKIQNAKTELRKAVHSLALRKLKKGEFDEETCAVCLETYKPREVVRILTCRHVFHRRCIDYWLLQHGICPLCNYAIIQKN